jgi:hypothetical protein
VLMAVPRRVRLGRRPRAAADHGVAAVADGHARLLRNRRVGWRWPARACPDPPATSARSPFVGVRIDGDDGDVAAQDARAGRRHAARSTGRTYRPPDLLAVLSSSHGPRSKDSYLGQVPDPWVAEPRPTAYEIRSTWPACGRYVSRRERPPHGPAPPWPGAAGGPGCCPILQATTTPDLDRGRRVSCRISASAAAQAPFFLAGICADGRRGGGRLDIARFRGDDADGVLPTLPRDGPSLGVATRCPDNFARPIGRHGPCGRYYQHRQTTPPGRRTAHVQPEKSPGPRRRRRSLRYTKR